MIREHLRSAIEVTPLCAFLFALFYIAHGLGG